MSGHRPVSKTIMQESITSIQTDQIKVCFLIPSHWAAAMGGAEYQVKLLLGEITRATNIQLWYLTRNIDPDFHPEGYEIRKVGTSRHSRYAMDAPGIFRALSEIQPHVIYCRVGTAYLGIAAHFCRLNSCRLIWHIASLTDVTRLACSVKNLIFPIMDKLILDYGIRRSDSIIAQSNEQSHMLSERFGYTDTKLELVRNFHPAPRETLSKDDHPIVLWIGNLKHAKQPEVFVQVAESLANSGAEFIMIGANQLPEIEFSRLESKIRQLPNLRYLGELSQSEVNLQLAKSHVLVNTSLVEGFSNTFIQAWMRRVPVVSLNSDPDDLLEVHGLGFIANGCLELLTEQTLKLIKNQDRREAMAHSAEHYVMKEHTLKNAARIIQLLVDHGSTVKRQLGEPLRDQ